MSSTLIKSTKDIASTTVTDHQGYTVRVYRKTESYGWQLMRPIRRKNNVQKQQPKKNGTISSRSNERRVVVSMKVIPKQGYIVLPRIHVRVRLSYNHMTSSTNNPPPPPTTTTNMTVTDENDCNDNTEQQQQQEIRRESNNNNDDTTKDAIKSTSIIGRNHEQDVLVIRRRNMILIISSSNTTSQQQQQQNRTLVLQFPNYKSCLQFSDELVRLNPSLLLSSSSSSSSIIHPTITTMNVAHSNDTNNKQQQQEEDDEMMMSYIGRLLYDDEFGKFCTTIEQYMMKTEDGMHYLLQNE